MSRAAALLDRLGRPGAVRLGGATAASPPARLSTGLPDLDGALDGGLPRGRVTELVGPRSHGRTGLACRIAASATGAGEIVAWIDPEDALDPRQTAAAGATLSRLLWVRPRDAAGAFRAAEVLLGAGGFGLIVLDLGLGLAGSGAPRRSPTAVWTRLTRAAAATRSTLLVLATIRQAGSCATLALELVASRARWTGGPGRCPLFDGLTARLVVARSRCGNAERSIVVRQACA